MFKYGVALKSIWIKECIRFLRIWVQTLVPPAITMSLYFVIFGNLIGSRIGDMGGFSYMEFIVPGLIMMSVITNSYSNVASSFYSTKFQKSIEELLVAPVPNYIIVLGYMGGGMTRGMLVGLIVTCVSLLFVDIQIHNIFVIMATVILTSAVFALGGLINAIYANSFDDLSIIPTFLLPPLTHLGRVFSSIPFLPDFCPRLPPSTLTHPHAHPPPTPPRPPHPFPLPVGPTCRPPFAPHHPPRLAHGARLVLLRPRPPGTQRRRGGRRAGHLDAIGALGALAHLGGDGFRGEPSFARPVGLPAGLPGHHREHGAEQPLRGADLGRLRHGGADRGVGGQHPARAQAHRDHQAHDREPEVLRAIRAAREDRRPEQPQTPALPETVCGQRLETDRPLGRAAAGAPRGTASGHATGQLFGRTGVRCGGHP